MEPEEKALLERTAKLSEENNLILRKLQRYFRWGFIWGFVKVAIIVTPLIAGYFLLQPFFGEAKESFDGLMKMLSL